MLWPYKQWRFFGFSPAFTPPRIASKQYWCLIEMLLPGGCIHNLIYQRKYYFSPVCRCRKMILRNWWFNKSVSSWSSWIDSIFPPQNRSWKLHLMFSGMTLRESFFELIGEEFQYSTYIAVFISSQDSPHWATFFSNPPHKADVRQCIWVWILPWTDWMFTRAPRLPVSLS